MDKEPRKATDVLLDLESKIDLLLGVVRSQDLQLKLISNKLTELLNSKKSEPPKIVVEAVNTVSSSNAPKSSILQNLSQLDPEKNILISSDDKIPVEENPQGFRRTSRAETFEGDDAILKPPPKHKEAEIFVPVSTKKQAPIQAPVKNVPNQQAPQNAIPVVQRITDKNGKAVFLADVVITDLSTNQIISKTRTNATGKWQASLPIGAYHITINKMEALNKAKIEAAQDLRVDGSESMMTLPMMIIK